MVKAGTNNIDFIMMLKELMASAWDERKVSKEWVDAIFIPIAKKERLWEKWWPGLSRVGYRD